MISKKNKLHSKEWADEILFKFGLLRSEMPVQAITPIQEIRRRVNIMYWRMQKGLQVTCDPQSDLKMVNVNCYDFIKSKTKGVDLLANGN